MYELEGLEKQLRSLLSRYTSEELRTDSKPFCSDFRKLVEEYASRWQVPLPQLRILGIALCYFAQASTFFATNCDHVLHTLSSLALSVFELLLFFDQRDLHQEPLKLFTVTFQECHLILARHQNVHLLQVERLVRGGGPWACPALQAILSESSLPQNDVDGCISSELPVFFELRVRYLLSCERVSEAMALAKCCAWHPTAGQHLFFLQVYLTWLHKTSQHDSLHKEVSVLNGKDAIHIICSLEGEEKDELLLALSRAFLSQQLCKGDMCHLCDLVLIWSELHSRLKTSKQALLEESHQLMLSATNVNSIFPFIRAIMQELGEDGIQFSVELCANALESCLPCDVITKSLIYKTIAGLLPNDLEVCRACALLVFFLERTVEAYKTVYLLYMHPDQEYHVEHSPISNRIRFETLQVLKKDLYFDPEFWNLIALRTNCLKLMSEKVVSAALEEIMEDKWIHNYCTKEPAFRSSKSGCQRQRKGALTKRRHHKEDRHNKEDSDAGSKRLKVSQGKTRLNIDHTVKRKGNQGSRPLKDASSEPLRRSFWQLDRLRDNGGYGEHRRTTRLSEKNPPKRRIRKPKWLLEDSGTLGENSVPPKIKRHGLKHQKLHQPSVERRSEAGQIKNNEKQKPSADPHLSAKENNHKHEKGFALEAGLKPAAPPQVVLELSLPDNELMGTFIEDTCNRQRGFPQVLLYKPTLKLPATSQPAKSVHRKKVILRARDATMFVQQLHCYARRQKGKGTGLNVHSSVSTITRSSVQGSPLKDAQGEPCEKPPAEVKGRFAVQSHAAAEEPEPPGLEKVQPVKAASRKNQSARELSEKSAVEMKVTVASQAPAPAKAAESARKLSQPKTRAPAEKKATGASQPPASADTPEAPTLDEVLQVQTKDLCHEPAVEMKVTIASQTAPACKTTPSPGLENPTKARTDKDAPQTPAEKVQTTAVNNNQVAATEEVSNTPIMSNTGAADQRAAESRVSGDGNRPSSRAETGVPDVRPGGKATSTGAPADQDGVNDMSALTLVTEMVTEITPEALARKRPGPEGHAPAVSRGGGSEVPRESRGCSGLGPRGSAAADVQEEEEDEGPLDLFPETPEGGEPVESEESKLEYCCTFCNKVFKGSRVVAHAMFHYRKDECMFCGTMFKDDLLAMMHLSDHIEKLKRCKESGGNGGQENGVSETKDTSAPKASAKAKTSDAAPGPRGRGRPRKSPLCPKSPSLPDSAPSGSRELRSADKPSDGPSPKEKRPSAPKHHGGKSPADKMNGHLGKKRELDKAKDSEAKRSEVSQDEASGVAVNHRLQKNVKTDSASSAQVNDKEASCKEIRPPHVLKTASKQDGKVSEEKFVQSFEKVSCPVAGCSWFRDLSKNRVALLYHALEDHSGEAEPLELAFRVGNGRCSVCMRVLWSFEHFRHHVERHRLAPRHPCLHRGCSARFKTGMEMRRHTRRHEPLQAECCLPGCSRLFICLWALNLHEREHYSARLSKPGKNASERTGDKNDNNSNTATGRKQPKDESAAAAENKTASAKAARKSRGAQGSTGKQVKAPPPTTARASLPKDESEDSHVLKNLSNKDTSAQPAGRNLRLRQTLRKVRAAGAGLKSRRVISSSLLKHGVRGRHKFRKKQVKVSAEGAKRRGRPPKSSKAPPDENDTAARGDAAGGTDPGSPARPASPPDAADAPNVSEGFEGEGAEWVRDAAGSPVAPSDEFKAKKSAKKTDVKQKCASHHTPAPKVRADGSNHAGPACPGDKTQTPAAVGAKKQHKAEKRSAPNDGASRAASPDLRKPKKHKVAGGKANAEIKRKCPVKEPECIPAKAAKTRPEPTAATGGNGADEEGNAKAENADPAQNTCGDSAPAVPADQPIAEPPAASGKKRPKGTTEGRSKGSHAKKREGKKERSAPAASGEKSKKSREKKEDGGKSRMPGPKKAKLKTGERQAETETAVAPAAAAAGSLLEPEGKAKEEMAVAPAATEENTNKKPPKKAARKRKVGHGDGAAASEAEGATSGTKKRSSPGSEVKAEEGKMPQTSHHLTTLTAVMNGQASAEDSKSTLCMETLAEYAKKPYLRPPPTAYLEEKYTTMPKRRKEAPLPPAYQRGPQARPPAGAQRQRCANCFATFGSGEELQGHRRLQKCSNLFGFDSDEEGNS